MKALAVAIVASAVALLFPVGSLAGLSGKQLLPREIAAAGHPYWQNYELTKAIAVSLGESAGYLGAWHDNLNAAGTQVLSRDCGLFQINIPANQVGSAKEYALRSSSLEPSAYKPVLANNIARAYQLYMQPWVGRPHRLWQPWVAYTTGWATFPQWWAWHQNAAGKPVGPWVATGRYIQRAIAGQMNYHVVILKDWSPQRALFYARKYAAHFGVHTGSLYISKGVVAWSAPAKPTVPPADGIGPRPISNDGA